MKTLFLSTDLSQLGGIQRYNRTFIAVLRELGITVKVVELKGGGHAAKVKFALKAFWRSLVFRPDAILCSHINFATLCYGINKILGTRYIVTLFGIEARGADTMQHLKLLRAAHRICTVSDWTAANVLAAAPDLKKKMFYLENPIDGDEFQPGPKKEELLERYHVNGRKVLLTVARLSAKEHYKGYDRVIEALSTLKPSHDFLYILVGDGDDCARVEAVINQLGLKNDVVLAGVVSSEELADHYRLADVFVMPSRFDGFGFVFVEALACGIPTIAGNADGSPHALLEGKLGLLVDPTDAKDIAVAVKKVLTREVRAEMLDPGFLRREVLEAYGIRKFRDKVQQLFHGL